MSPRDDRYSMRTLRPPHARDTAGVRLNDVTLPSVDSLGSTLERWVVEQGRYRWRRRVAFISTVREHLAEVVYARQQCPHGLCGSSKAK